MDESEQQLLADLLTMLLTGLYAQIGKAQFMCRLCDRESCTAHGDSTCPVGAAERHCLGEQ
ncbi:hypothetical protein [Rhodococcus jostii]|uniref:hypothetical protein n=1 Tax=Rhodococcus jostii TaxID=132919 RepID=UPI0036275484